MARDKRVGVDVSEHSGEHGAMVEGEKRQARIPEALDTLNDLVITMEGLLSDLAEHMEGVLRPREEGRNAEPGQVQVSVGQAHTPMMPPIAKHLYDIADRVRVINYDAQELLDRLEV